MAPTLPPHVANYIQSYCNWTIEGGTRPPVPRDVYTYLDYADQREEFMQYVRSKHKYKTIASDMQVWVDQMGNSAPGDVDLFEQAGYEADESDN